MVDNFKKDSIIDTLMILLGFPFIVVGYLSHKVLILLKAGWTISRDFD